MQLLCSKMDNQGFSPGYPELSHPPSIETNSMKKTHHKKFPPPLFLFANTLIGAIGGALFGVGFGALASFFEGGPELITGIQESWLWFAVMGSFIGIGGCFPYRD